MGLLRIVEQMPETKTAGFRLFLFDLDGTLVDSVYQHVLAWRDAFEAAGIPLAVWRIHRRIGMSGGLFVSALARETGRSLSREEEARMQELHAQDYQRYSTQVRPLPGARELLAYLAQEQVPHAIATSGYREAVDVANKMLGVGPEIPIITGDQVAHAKPDPDLFFAAAAALGIPIEHSIVVGDSIWDLLAARRARARGIGLLSGGYGADELQSAGAYRVYEDPADLLAHLDEVRVRAR
jgi:HAD superfamily hydrolase (TIGR01509 family)